MFSQHQMNLNHDEIEKIKCHKKTREYRLYDEKRRKINKGDEIIFHDVQDFSNTITVQVVGLLIYKDWFSCYKEFFEQDLGASYENIEQAVNDTYQNWWSKEKEEKYGCLIIEIHLI